MMATAKKTTTATKAAPAKVTTLPTKKTTPPATVPTKKTNTLPAAAGSLTEMMFQDAGKGFEETNKDSFAVPFIVLLQDLSPQTKSKMAGYVQGAKPGMIYNTVTQKTYDGEEGIWVVPAHFSQVFIEWVPRGEGGGFVAAYPPEVGQQKLGTTVRDKSKQILPNGNELSDTRQHFVIVQDPETGESYGALIAFKSTGIKFSKRWLSQTRQPFTLSDGRVVNSPPMFACKYRLVAEEVANDQGSWYQFNVAEQVPLSDHDMQLYMAARAFQETMRAGGQKIDYEGLQGAGGGDVPSGGGGDRAPADLDDSVDEEV